MVRRHEKGAALPQRDANPDRSPAEVTSINFTRSDREIVALFDAAVYRAVLAKQREVMAFLSGGGRVHSR